jgi:hypothetical protein
VISVQVTAVSTTGLTVNISFGGAPPPPPGPPNDNFASATAVGTLPRQISDTNVDATTQTGEPLSYSCGGAATAIGKTLWYTYRPTASSNVTIDTAGSNFDTVVGVFTGTAVNALTGVACNDDIGNVRQARVTFLAQAGNTYQIQIGGFRNAQTTESGTVAINMTSAAVPVNCSPRPPVRLTTTRGAAGVLNVTVGTTSANNVIQSLQFGGSGAQVSINELVDIGGFTGAAVRSPCR